MLRAINDVTDFHHACGLPVLDKPQFPSTDRVTLRCELIAEEVAELSVAVLKRDLPKVADGLGDIIYVCIGMALEFGIPLADVWAEIQRSNMAKRDPVTNSIRRRADGKVLKPDGWKAPDIEGVI